MLTLHHLSAVAYYLPVILQQAVGLPHTTALILSSVAAVQFFIVSLIPVWVIEKLGRRTWMIWGAVAQMLCMVLVVVGFNVEKKGGGILVTTMFFVFYDAFAVRFVPVLLAFSIVATPLTSSLTATSMYLGCTLR